MNQHNTDISKTPDIRLRPGKPEDARLIAWTVLTALDLPADDTDRFAKACAREDTLYSWSNTIAAEVNGIPAGCLVSYDGSLYHNLREFTWPLCWPESLLPKDMADISEETGAGEYYLDSMALKPEFRGLGIGRRLISEALSKAKSLGFDTAALLVDTDKPRLEALYASIGFQTSEDFIFFGHKYHRMRITL